MELEAVGVAVAGWLAVHLLTIRAQRKNFVNQITNDGRKQITAALREYQDWCSTVSARLWGLTVPFLEGVPPWSQERWIQEGRELITLFHSPATLKWVFAIEENEILFPQLRRLRQQLGDRQREISAELGRFLDTIWTDTNRRRGVETVQQTVEQIRDQHALVEYLYVYVQNLALSPLARRKQPVPAPRDVTLLRLIERGSGLEFGLGEPLGGVALAMRRLRYGAIRPILQENLPEQRALFRRMRQEAKGYQVPASDWWIQGEGTNMSAQVLNAQTGRGMWLKVGTPDEIVASFTDWLKRPDLECPTAVL